MRSPRWVAFPTASSILLDWVSNALDPEFSVLAVTVSPADGAVEVREKSTPPAD